MIKFFIIIKSNHWPRRLVRINKIINKIIKYKEILKFKKNVMYYCNFILMNDNLIKKYNNIYKKNNKSTDVLTFVSIIKNKCLNEKHCDIMISAETLNNDAKQDNKDFYIHFTHLAVHSILHINGYTHNNKKNYLTMKLKEIEILKKIGITNPY